MADEEKKPTEAAAPEDEATLEAAKESGVSRESLEEEDKFQYKKEDVTNEKLAEKADEKGNISFHGATRNFNTYMGAAADIAIVEAQEVVKVGEMCPDEVVVPGVFIDRIVDGGAL